MRPSSKQRTSGAASAAPALATCSVIRVRRSRVDARWPTVGDPAELLDVHVDQLARRVALGASRRRPGAQTGAGGRVARARRGAWCRVRTLCTVDRLSRSRNAIRAGPERRDTRSPRIRRSVRLYSCWGERCGRLSGRPFRSGPARGPAGPTLRRGDRHVEPIRRAPLRPAVIIDAAGRTQPSGRGQRGLRWDTKTSGWYGWPSDSSTPDSELFLMSSTTPGSAVSVVTTPRAVLQSLAYGQGRVRRVRSRVPPAGGE